ncbi:hypothetical protein Anapl_11997 [Anas platyrhynchos]|uniref:Uncharacterized protein n=1 Tax=Anas platyrhynchos TaxID=8839 RepID=R0JZU8_ANAPL|nr:hypothetical protein Anapl_11997 [Anas platyrhynchos]
MTVGIEAVSRGPYGLLKPASSIFLVLEDMKMGKNKSQTTLPSNEVCLTDVMQGHSSPPVLAHEVGAPGSTNQNFSWLPLALRVGVQVLFLLLVCHAGPHRNDLAFYAESEQCLIESLSDFQVMTKSPTLPHLSVKDVNCGH